MGFLLLFYPIKNLFNLPDKDSFPDCEELGTSLNIDEEENVFLTDEEELMEDALNSYEVEKPVKPNVIERTIHLSIQTRDTSEKSTKLPMTQAITMIIEKPMTCNGIESFRLVLDTAREQPCLNTKIILQVKQD